MAKLVESEIAVLEITNGKIFGLFNGQYYYFKGIPYAEPPIGEKRFESPKPLLKKWKGIRDATKSANTCLCMEAFIHIKTGALANYIRGSEDCLYLNVYTPKIYTEQLLPVVFFIHGGSFTSGSGDVLQENTLMKHKNLILVTFNYRLGPLGFISTEDDQISGNMGLKDQRVALEWVYNNIKFFGGDPQYILMAGFSAGGASVEFQIIQPGIENLIKAAISFSGSALCPWAINPNPLEDTIKVAKILNCSNIISTIEIKKCLKQAPAEDIVGTTENFLIYLYHPGRIWAPSIESPLSNDAILLEKPENLIRKGFTNRVPYLSSCTSEDGVFVNAELLRFRGDGTVGLDYFNEHYKEFLPVILFYNERIHNRKELDIYTEKLYEDVGIFNGTVTLENFDKLTRIFTKELITDGVFKSWRLHKENGNIPIYNYVYSNPATFGLAHYITMRDDINFGCGHGDDVFLIFNFPERDLKPFSESELRISDNLVKMLETFVLTGVPKFDNETLPSNFRNSVEKLQFLNITSSSARVEILP
ncbi:esterase-5B [Condylostylus longicornis]|uniref:esterase-5B n=1 Tax=Condylostylus longicornis TaxID=2530218 RepID=UPI00244E2D82|nr:esterase-5B [Condylostylus longicornis]